MMSAEIEKVLARALDGERPDAQAALKFAECDDLDALMRTAAELRDRGHGRLVSYSRKVFIPLTKLCRDSCHYCTFAHPPRKGERAYLTPEEVLAIAARGQAGRLPGGAVHARRQAGAALSRGARGAGGTRREATLDYLGAHGGAGAGARPDCCRMSIPAS